MKTKHKMNKTEKYLLISGLAAITVVIAGQVMVAAGFMQGTSIA